MAGVLPAIRDHLILLGQHIRVSAAVEENGKDISAGSCDVRQGRAPKISNEEAILDMLDILDDNWSLTKPADHVSNL